MLLGVLLLIVVSHSKVLGSSIALEKYLLGYLYWVCKLKCFGYLVLVIKRKFCFILLSIFCSWNLISLMKRIISLTQFLKLVFENLEIVNFFVLLDFILALIGKKILILLLDFLKYYSIGQFFRLGLSMDLLNLIFYSILYLHIFRFLYLKLFYLINFLIYLLIIF